jgi:hypothetical protein
MNQKCRVTTLPPAIVIESVKQNLMIYIMEKKKKRKTHTSTSYWLCIITLAQVVP